MPPAFNKISQRRFENPHCEIKRGCHTDHTAFTNVFFERALYDDSKWTDCRFKFVTFDRASVFRRCVFDRCKFEGSHTHLSGRFEDCVFVDCTFKHGTFGEARFFKCMIKATFENMAFWGPESEDWQTVLEHVDFRGSTFIDSDFRSGIDLSTCQLPPGFDPFWLFPPEKARDVKRGATDNKDGTS